MLFVVLSAASVAQQRLKNYDELIRALTSGKAVRAVAHYKKMTLIGDGKEEKESVDAIGGVSIDAWEQFAKGVVRNDKAYVAFSHTNLIAHPRYGHVYNYVRFRVYEDGVVEITARYLDATSYKVVMDETFRGKISDSKDKEGVNFFAQR